MDRLIALPQARMEAKQLLVYIDLVELYEADTLEKLIIKEYAYTYSIRQVLKIFKERGITKDNRAVEREDIVAVLKKKSADPLHRIVRRMYMRKISHTKR